MSKTSVILRECQWIVSVHTWPLGLPHLPHDKTNWLKGHLSKPHQPTGRGQAAKGCVHHCQGRNMSPIWTSHVVLGKHCKTVLREIVLLRIPAGVLSSSGPAWNGPVSRKVTQTVAWQTAPFWGLPWPLDTVSTARAKALELGHFVLT